MAEAAAELQLLEAMYPGCLELDPPDWHEGADPELPVSGVLAPEGGQAPALSARFTLSEGYPEREAALRLRLECEGLPRGRGEELDAWAARRIRELVAGGSAAPLTEAIGALEEGLELVRPPEGEPPPEARAEAPSRAVAFAEEPPPRHSGLREGRIDRQWVTFISFTSSKIAKEFCEAAASVGVTGFLMVGKPGIACLEGGPRAIQELLRTVRTDVFAQVDPAARKMSLSILEEACTRVRFDGFAAKDLSNAGHCPRGASVDTGSSSCSLTNKKRTARADLLHLKEFLLSRGIAEKTFERVTMHVQNDV